MNNNYLFLVFQVGTYIHLLSNINFFRILVITFTVKLYKSQYISRFHFYSDENPIDNWSVILSKNKILSDKIGTNFNLKLFSLKFKKSYKHSEFGNGPIQYNKPINMCYNNLKMDG